MLNLDMLIRTAQVNTKDPKVFVEIQSHSAPGKHLLETWSSLFFLQYFSDKSVKIPAQEEIAGTTETYSAENK